MSKFKYINSTNFIEKIKVFRNYKNYKVSYDFNFENDEFMLKLSSMIFTDKKEYSSDEFEKVLRTINIKLNNEIFLDNSNIKLKSHYVIFYTGRGWSLNIAKAKVNNITSITHPIFFSKNEILEYFKNVNSYDINLNNKEYITKLLDYIFIPYGNITIIQLYKLLRTFWIQFYPNMKKCTRGRITVNKAYWVARGYSEEEAKQIISDNFKKHSIYGVEHYKNKGYSEEEAKQIISDIQKKNASKTKHHKKYWINLGLSEEDAIKKAKEYAELSSVWSKKHWMNMGYSEEDAILKCLEYNGSSSLCKKYLGNIQKFYEHMLNFSNNCKNRYIQHRSELNLETDNDKKIKLLKLGYGKISKSETKCFEVLKNINDNIMHKPYIVSFPDDFISLQNKVCYICDGYLKHKDYYIIFEYDGGIGKYHDEDVDKIKSEEILLVDENVLGIIRIQESLFKNYKLLIAENGLANIINNAIEKIKTGKDQIIILK